MIGRGVELSVAAFGKHRGWNDHIDDLGLDTQRLVDFKRMLYIDGIAACIEGGRWDKLEAGHVTEGFGHVFVYRGGGDLIAGRMWSSQDGKGRSRYPMVLCVHTRGLSLEDSLPMILPALRTAQTRCQAAATAPEVVQIVAQVRESLRARAEQIEGRRTEIEVAGSVARELAERPAMSPDHQGFHRVMYQFDRELQTFLRGQSQTRSRIGDLSPRHLRVPACWDDPIEVLTRWMSFLYLRVEPWCPAMLLLPVGDPASAEGGGGAAIGARVGGGGGVGPWLDVIVGEPTGPELFCIRASEKLVPTASQIPYNIEPDLRLRYEQFIAEAASMKPEPVRSPAPLAGEAAAAPQVQRKRPIAIIAVVLVVLLLLSLAWLLLGPRPEAASPAPSAPANVPAPSGGDGLKPSARRSSSPAAADTGQPERTHAGASFVGNRAGSLPGGWAAAVVCAIVGSHDAAISSPSPQPADQQVREDLRARDQIVPGSEAINALWRDQRNRLLASYDALQSAEMTAHAGRIESALVAFAKEVSAGLTGREALRGRAWVGDLDAELSRRREQRLARLRSAFRGQLIDPADPAVSRTLSDAASDISDLTGRFAGMAADLASVEQNLEQAHPPGDAVARWEAEGILKDRAVRAAVAPVLDRVRAIGEIERQEQTEPLLELVSAQREPPPGPELVLAVWRRLGARQGTPWPRSPQDLQTELKLADQVASIASTLPDPARRAALEAEIADQRRARVLRMLSLADTHEQLAAAAAAMPGAGLRTESLDARVRFNLLLHKLATDLAAPPPSDQAASALAAEFVRGVRELPGGIAFLADASAVIDAIEQTLAAGAVASAPIDPLTLGPAATGRYSARAEGGRLIFVPSAPSSAGTTLEFVRIDPAPESGLDPFYLGTTEVSVAMFTDIVRGAGVPVSHFILPVDPLTDTRLGPRTWEWDAPRGIPIAARQWLIAVSANPSEQYEGGKPPGRPGPEHPMQHISPMAAACAARAVGCRLPQAREWLAAHASTAGTGGLNLRDQSWARHQSHVNRQLAAGKNVQPADAGTYWTDEARTADADDGYLWLAPVSVGGGGPLRHLRGNVAEWVLDSPRPLNTGDPLSPEAFDFASANPEAFRIAGASALSDAGASAVEPRPVRLIDAGDGFADVGFRLAFAAGSATSRSEPLSGRLARALTPPPFLRPR